jgi:hypothetical protein
VLLRVLAASSLGGCSSSAPVPLSGPLPAGGRLGCVGRTRSTARADPIWCRDAFIPSGLAASHPSAQLRRRCLPLSLPTLVGPWSVLVRGTADSTQPRAAPDLAGSGGGSPPPGLVHEAGVAPVVSSGRGLRWPVWYWASVVRLVAAWPVAAGVCPSAVVSKVSLVPASLSVSCSAFC